MYSLHSDVLVELVLCPSSAAAAEPLLAVSARTLRCALHTFSPPVSMPPSRPFDVDVDVEPELFDCRGARAEPVRLPVGAAKATDESIANRKQWICILPI